MPVQSKNFGRIGFFGGQRMKIIVNPSAPHAETPRLAQAGHHFTGSQIHKLEAVGKYAHNPVTPPSRSNRAFISGS